MIKPPKNYISDKGSSDQAAIGNILIRFDKGTYKSFAKVDSKLVEIKQEKQNIRDNFKVSYTKKKDTRISNYKQVLRQNLVERHFSTNKTVSSNTEHNSSDD